MYDVGGGGEYFLSSLCWPRNSRTEKTHVGMLAVVCSACVVVCLDVHACVCESEGERERKSKCLRGCYLCTPVTKCTSQSLLPQPLCLKAGTQTLHKPRGTRTARHLRPPCSSGTTVSKASNFIHMVREDVHSPLVWLTLPLQLVRERGRERERGMEGVEKEGGMDGERESERERERDRERSV